MSNSLEIDKLVDNDFRKNLPRYSGEYLENNRNLANEFALFAKEKIVHQRNLQFLGL